MNADEQDGRGREEAEDLGRAPAMAVPLDERVAEREEEADRGHETREVDALLGGGVPRLADRELRDHDPEHADRDVDEEDPVPVQVLHDQAAAERADRQRERRHSGPDPDRLPALLRREGGDDDGERRRVHECRADALHRARSDQEACARGEPARERGEREDREPDDEDAAAAVEVRELAAGDQERGERERVGDHDPLELRDRDVEVALHRRQRHVHHRVVEHDHEEAERDRRQRHPLAVLLGQKDVQYPCSHVSLLVRS